ncbi:hypothetical protein [Haladaptatus halobius]|uniref:hypothetical protein n=1 Tax=Haladaptatus halobius TaxID=2884875 RepID=UPI001D0B0B65|nr:hypothetical protein [Haladaptatus halobius]
MRVAKNCQPNPVSLFSFLSRQTTLLDVAQRTLTECADTASDNDDTPTTERELFDRAQHHAAVVAATHFPDLLVGVIDWEVTQNQ